jgi:homoserine dehydrogenase
MFGKGAGAFPTGSAVLSDITALSHNYKYEYKKRKFFKQTEFTNDYSLKVYLRYNREEDFDLFEFDEIYERYSGRGTNYVIGKICLKNLLKLQDKIEKLPLFVSVIP